MARYQVVQTTTYAYSPPARRTLTQCRLKPADDRHQRLLSFRMKIEPTARVHEHVDYFGNHAATFDIWAPHSTLTIRTESLLEVHRGPYDAVRHVLDRDPSNPANERARWAEYLAPTDYTRAAPDVLEKLSHDAWHTSATDYDYAWAIARQIYRRFRYVPGDTTVETTAEEFIAQGRGVCQDFAHLMIALLRCRGIPARYISGYIDCGQDAALRGDAATHAWVEALMPGRVWVGFDPTNNTWINNQYVRLAMGRD
jgi:transglutaminase-like putative cysteine protease